MEWHFRVDGIPATQGSKKAFVRGGKVSMVEVSKKLPAWRKDVAAAAAEVADTDGTGPLDFPLEVKLDVYLPVPKKSKFGNFPAGPPDVDKLQRAVGDALKVGGLIKDDARICRWVAEKHWADEDHAVGCEVRIRQLTAEEAEEIISSVDVVEAWMDEAGVQLTDWQRTFLESLEIGPDKVHAYRPTAGHTGHNFAGAEWTTDPGDLPGISQSFGPASRYGSYQPMAHGPVAEAVIREYPISRESAELFFGRPLPEAIPPEEIREALDRFSQRKEQDVWVSNDRVGFRIQDPVFTEMEGGLGVTGTFPEFLAPFLRAGLIRGVSVSIDGDPETTLSATLVPEVGGIPVEVDPEFDRNEFAFRIEPRALWGLDGDLSKPFPDEPENRMEAGL